MIGIGKTSNFTWDGTETDITVIGKNKNSLKEKSIWRKNWFFSSFSCVILLGFICVHRLEFFELHHWRDEKSRPWFTKSNCHFLLPMLDHLRVHHHCISHHLGQIWSPWLRSCCCYICQSGLRVYGLDHSNFCGLFNFWSSKWNFVDFIKIIFCWGKVRQNSVKFMNG